MARVAIYSGHGGRDSGACAYGRREKDYALNLANGVAAILKNAGHEVLQNKTSDVDRNITADANRANSWGADYVIEFHFNAGGGTGCETICSIVGGKSRELAHLLSKRIENLGFRNRGVKTRIGDNGRDYFGIIRQTKAPAVIVEVCFIDNINDMELYESNDMMPNHIADEIYNYIK